MTDKHVRWQAFHLAKRGHRPDEYEDAFASDPKSGRFAVADGASESSFAGLWAKLLVEGFVRPERGAGESGWLEPLRKRWAKAVDGKPLPWYSDEKRKDGAFATFLGLALKPATKGGGGRWRALAVGDSCLFQVRKDRLVQAFPVQKSGDFGNSPMLLGSRPRLKTQRKKVEWGQWQPSDRFFLMTDALAQWFLRRHEKEMKPWLSLLARLQVQPKPDTALTEYVQRLRNQNELRNDDVTLLAIDL